MQTVENGRCPSIDTMTDWSPFDVPYELHTTRELECMLKRGKPLAHFSDFYPPEPDEKIVPQGAFAPYVANGTFEMRVFVTLERRTERPEMGGAIHVFYARPCEAWRIDAFIAMMAAAARSGWSEGFERLEGFLLGYTEAQTDAHLKHLLKAPHASDVPWLKRLLNERGK
jgi:hypothetical protein